MNEQKEHEMVEGFTLPVQKIRFTNVLSNVSNPLAGPVNINKGFKTQGGVLSIQVSGSAWSINAEQVIGIKILVNENLVGTCKRYTNEAPIHRTLVPVTIIVNNIEPGNNFIQLQGFEGTVADQFDFFNVTITEYIGLT